MHFGTRGSEPSNRNTHFRNTVRSTALGSTPVRWREPCLMGGHVLTSSIQTAAYSQILSVLVRLSEWIARRPNGRVFFPHALASEDFEPPSFPHGNDAPC